MLFLYFTLSLLLIFPQLFIQYPSLINDGYDFVIAQKVSYFEIFKDHLLNSSRFRPFNFMYRKLLYSLFGMNIQYHFLFQALIFFGICYFSYLLLIKLGINKSKSILIGLLIAVLPSTIDNFYQLGTIEHVQALILIISLYSISLNKKYFALFALTINFFFKETSIFFLLVPVIYGYINKDRKCFFYSFILLFLGSSLLVYKMLFVPDFYTSMFALNFKNILFTIRHFPFSFIILLFSTIYLFLKTNKLDKNYILLYIALWLSVIMFFFWKAVGPYYHFPSEAISSLLFIYLIKDLTYIKYYILSILIIFIFSLKGTKTLYWDRMDYLEDSVFVEYILSQEYNNYHIYSAVNNYEKNLSIFNYLIDINRNKASFLPDTEEWSSVDYLDSEYFSNKVFEVQKAFFNDNYNKKMLITDDADLMFNEGEFIKKYFCFNNLFNHGCSNIVIILRK